MTDTNRIEAWKAGELFLELYREFDRFDVKNTPVLIAPLSAYAREARKILSDRSKEQIEYACMLAEWTVHAPLDEIIAEQRGEDTELFIELSGNDDETFPRLLQRRQGLIDLYCIEDLKRARWQEMYAATTLAYVARAINCGETSSMEAAEAYQIALSFVQRSDSASKRHSRWKEKALRYADGKEDISAEKIAGYFLDYFEDEIKKSRNGKLFAQRTVADWIRDSRKRT